MSDERDYLDEVAELRAEGDPEIAAHWAAIKLFAEIRDAGEKKGLTQAQIAECMGVSLSGVARIEKRPWAAEFARILAYANAVGVDLCIGVEKLTAGSAS